MLCFGPNRAILKPMKSTLILAIEFAALLRAQVPDLTPPTPLLGALDA